MGRANGVTVLHMAAFVLGSGTRSVQVELSAPVYVGCGCERLARHIALAALGDRNGERLETQ
jgi:hypothetical protein